MAITAPPPSSGPQRVLAHNLLHNLSFTVLVVAFAIAPSAPEKQAWALLPRAAPTALEQGLARAVVFEKGKEPFLSNFASRSWHDDTTSAFKKTSGFLPEEPGARPRAENLSSHPITNPSPASS